MSSTSYLLSDVSESGVLINAFSSLVSNTQYTPIQSTCMFFNLNVFFFLIKTNSVCVSKIALVMPDIPHCFPASVSHRGWIIQTRLLCSKLFLSNSYVYRPYCTQNFNYTPKPQTAPGLYRLQHECRLQQEYQCLFLIISTKLKETHTAHYGFRAALTRGQPCLEAPFSSLAKTSAAVSLQFKTPMCV